MIAYLVFSLRYSSWKVSNDPVATQSSSLRVCWWLFLKNEFSDWLLIHVYVQKKFIAVGWERKTVQQDDSAMLAHVLKTGTWKKKKIKETKEEEIKEIKWREDPDSLIKNVVGSAPANGGDVRQENDWQTAQICCFPLFHSFFFSLQNDSSAEELS